MSEPRLVNQAGWESWLESQTSFDARLVDKMVVVGFYLVEMLYYAIACAIGVDYANRNKWSSVAVGSLALSYFVLFVIIAALAVRQPRVRTRLVDEIKPKVVLP